MPDYPSPYLARMQADETRTLLKRLVPEVVWLYRLRRRYRKAFPGAFVSVRADVAQEAKIATGCIVRAGCHVSRTVSIGRCTTLGDDCLLRGHGRIDIGPFCSIGPEVVILSENHVLDRLTTYPLALYAGAPDAGGGEFTSADVILGADVWVGQRAIVLAGARIGTGSVIAAGSVVPKGEYEPYTVWGGAPARKIKDRLDPQTREALLASQWWLAGDDRIFGDWVDDLHERRWQDTQRLSRT